MTSDLLDDHAVGAEYVEAELLEDILHGEVSRHAGHSHLHTEYRSFTRGNTNFPEEEIQGFLDRP